MAAAVRDPDPVIVVEPKVLYATKADVPDGEIVDRLGEARVVRAGDAVTVCALGAMVQVAVAAAETLAAEGVSAEVIDLRSLVPLDTRTLLDSVGRTGRLVTVEENPRLCGWGAEVASIVAEERLFDLDGPIVRVTTPHIPLPAADALEDLAIPSASRVVEGVRGRSDDGAGPAGRRPSGSSGSAGWGAASRATSRRAGFRWSYTTARDRGPRRSPMTREPTVAATPADAAARADVLITMLTDDAAVGRRLRRHERCDVGDGPREDRGGHEHRVARVLARTRGPRARGGRRDGGRARLGERRHRRERRPADHGRRHEEDVDRVRPVLETTSSAIVRVGAQGSGALLKVCVNAILFGLIQGLAEILVVAERSGIDREAAYEVIPGAPSARPRSSTGGGSSSTRARSRRCSPSTWR